jgi:hypothetical protein
VAYATIDDFRDFIGASRLVGMISVDPAEQESFITKLLNAGAASMNSVFAQAGYALPLTPAPAGELADLLTVHNCALAARPYAKGWWTSRLVSARQSTTQSTGSTGFAAARRNYLALTSRLQSVPSRVLAGLPS